MEPERVSEEDMERLRHRQGMHPGGASDLVHRHQTRAAAYARTDDNWLSLASTTSFDVEPRAGSSAQQTQPGQTSETQQVAQTNEPGRSMESIHSLCGPIPRTTRGHKRSSAISKRSSSPINRTGFRRLSPQLYFPDRAVPEHDPVAEPLPGFGMRFTTAADMEKMEKMTSPSALRALKQKRQQRQQEQERQREQQGQQGQPSQYPPAVSDPTASFQQTNTSSETQEEDKNGLVGSLEKMDIQ